MFSIISQRGTCILKSQWYHFIYTKTADFFLNENSKSWQVWLVFQIYDILIILQLAFFPSTIIFEILPIDACWVHAFELLHRVPPPHATTQSEGRASANGSAPLDTTANSDSMSISTSGSGSREQVVLWAHQEVERLCRCYFDRASWP